MTVKRVNFTGATVEDDPANDVTRVTLGGGGGTTYTPPYCIAAGGLGWYFDGYRIPRYSVITDQSGGFTPAWHVPDSFLDVPDGHSTFSGVQVPEPGLYRVSINVTAFKVKSAVDVPRIWYHPTWYPTELNENDDAGTHVPPPTGVDDWSLWWGAYLGTPGGDRGFPQILENAGSIGGIVTYSAGTGASVGGVPLVYQAMFGVGPDWGDWWAGSTGPQNRVGLVERFGAAYDFSGADVPLTQDLGSGASVGITWLTVEKVGDHVPGTTIRTF